MTLESCGATRVRVPSSMALRVGTAVVRVGAVVVRHHVRRLEFLGPCVHHEEQRHQPRDAAHAHTWSPAHSASELSVT